MFRISVSSSIRKQLVYNSRNTNTKWVSRPIFANRISSTTGADPKTGLKSDRIEWSNQAFANKSTSELLSACLIYRLSSMSSLVKFTPTLLKWAEKYHVSAPLYFFIKKTFFKHFCGGESAGDLVYSMKKLKESQVGSILDLAIEADIDENGITESYDQIEKMLIECIRTAASVPGSFSAMKITSLCQPNQLEVTSRGISKIRDAFIASCPEKQCFGLLDRKGFETMLAQIFPSSIIKSNIEDLFKQTDSDCDGMVTYSDCILLLYPKSLSLSHPNLFRHLYSGVDLDILNQLLVRLNHIAQTAAECKVRLMVDAEQSYFQPAIDYFVHEMQLKFNQPEFLIEGAPLVMNTHQMYLKAGIDNLKSDFERAKRAGYVFATKLVRGAYMVSERAYANTHGLTDPIHESKERTDAAYNRAIDFLLDRISAEKDISSNKVNNLAPSFIIASHNQSTASFAIDSISSRGLDPKSPLIGFAQLQGMSDHLSYFLAKNQFRVFKYLPYGPLREVIPYLLRRALENGDVLSSTYYDRILVQKALSERVSCIKKPQGFPTKFDAPSINNQ